MPFSGSIDFDSSDGLKLFHGALEAAVENQEVRDEQCERDYQNYHAFLDMALRNPDRSNVTIPKIQSIVSTKAPGEIKAAIGSRPYIPFTARRDEFKQYAEGQSKILDRQLELGGFLPEFTLAAVMKILYGTSFMEAVPYFKNEIRRMPIPIIANTPFGPEIVDYQVESVPIKLLRMKIRAWAQWEVKVDPVARGLEQADDCRYVIKIQIVSKHQIKKLAEAGAYPNLDIAKLDELGAGHDIVDHKGYDILSKMGLPKPADDSDVGILFRYESPDRYMDVWDSRLILRDTSSNPYDPAKGGHGLINLSKMIHDTDPHTQAAFYGNGEGKRNEILQALLNDLYNIAIDNHNFIAQGMTYYAKGQGVNAEKLVRSVGNKVGFELKPGQRIGDVIQDEHGQPLPADHYIMLQRTEDYMDLGSLSQNVSRGEESPGDQTLGEISLLKQAGDSVQELNIRTIESFLADFGRKCLSHIDQFSRFIDREEILGKEEAERLIMLNPRDLPGGYDFAFKGSDRVVNQLIRQQNLRTLDARIAQSPYLRERPWLEVLFDAHDQSSNVDKVLLTEEEFAANQQQQLAAIASIRGGQEQIPASTGPETPVEAAQEAGRAATPQQAGGAL
jgi:hypothetical protein